MDKRFKYYMIQEYKPTWRAFVMGTPVSIVLQSNEQKNRAAML